MDPGVRTIAGSHTALWRALSLQAEDRAEDQLAKAKATAMDINVLRSIGDFRQDQQFVALQLPKPKASEHLKDSVAWLEHQADDVILVESKEALSAAIEGKLLKAVSSSRRHTRA